MKKGALLESLETVLVVTVITALIWLYAEGETIISQNRTVQIKFVAPTTGLAITVLGEDPGTTTTSVSATIQASSGDWARISEWTKTQTVEIEVQPPPPATYENEQTINLLDALNNSPLAEARAFVKEVSPASTTVRVQKLEVVEMGMIVEPGELELSKDPLEAPTFDPEKVQVQMPSKDAILVRSLNLKLTAHLDRRKDSDTLVEDTQKTASVELSLPTELQNKPHVTLNQETVNVTFILDKLSKEIQLDRVQVRLNISDELTKYIFEIDPGTQRFIPVTLKGDEDIINKIEQDPDLVRAQITIKHSDLQEEPPYSAPLYIDVPEGVTILDPLPGQTFISYKFTDPSVQN
tara:strand:- start:104 stop:1156 length:1053 start_codon:yes stop_codon:yes gene_type:complete